MFLDTSGFLCILDSDDRRHEYAITLFENSGLKLTHSYVIAEFIAL